MKCSQNTTFAKLKWKKSYSSRDRGFRVPAPCGFHLAAGVVANFRFGACGFPLTRFFCIGGGFTAVWLNACSKKTIKLHHVS